ncbi:spidroin-2-like isoform X1 [Papaver somniferum]|uniref:spidroin-2-like isoform X1 n=1 Tax=Papaver somniferum TaxID=3469 RepID=UPI000E6F7E44|nr:spidroin-2-like isoform X1 [Papaver somniferum]
MAEEEIAGVVVETGNDVSSVPSDNKRKLGEFEPQENEEEEVSGKDQGDVSLDLNVNSDEVTDPGPDAKRPRLDDDSDAPAVENGHQGLESDSKLIKNEEQTSEVDPQDDNAENPLAGNVDTENPEHSTLENLETGNAQQTSDENKQTTDGQQPSGEDSEQQSTTRKMEVPNNKVGVLIGKAGETIRLLQNNSGAKIQITRDAEADRYATTRPVELIGSLENINKAEKLIRDVIAEADAGGSPSLVARGFNTVQASGAADQIQIQVPNEKVGLIIGKGGETIKSLQTRSGAKIQVLIPQHLPDGDQSKERIVRVTGDKKHIEIAREMIKEVMNQLPVRGSPLSGGYNQRSRGGASGPHSWGGSRAPAASHGSSYDYPQRGGMHSSHNPHYMPPPTYGGYPPQSGPRGGSFNGGWDHQRPSGPAQPHHSQGGSGYDYYGHGQGQGGGHAADAPTHAPVSNAAAPVRGSGPSTQGGYYGGPHPQGGLEYGQPPNYQQTAPPANQGYGHGYEDQKYGNPQPAYGGHGNPQPGGYGAQPPVNSQAGYGQQPYNPGKPPAYGMPPQGGPASQTYAGPRTGQPGEMPPYQGAYGSNMPTQQGYPYAASTGGPSQQTYPPYGAAPATSSDAYAQQPPHFYAQQGAHSGYSQPGAQPAPGYAQGGPVPYGTTQAGYGEQAVPNSAGYGYPGTAEAGYSNPAASGYGAAASGQAGYGQPAPSQTGYDQPIPQSAGYGSAPGAAAAAAPVGGYAKNVSPQVSFDSTKQMYGGGHH